MRFFQLVFAIIIFASWSGAATAQTWPTCNSAASDPDGDGWGWENNQSCKVVNNTNNSQCNWYGSFHPLCVSTTSGWGWENNKSCISRATCATAPNGLPAATSSSASSTANNTSIASNSSTAQHPNCTSAASDPDGDGWGWENNRSCKVVTSTQISRIMPLGDSITGSPGCWRAILWNDLASYGYRNLDFVGTLQAQHCAQQHDANNEGHGGYLATQIANNNLLPAWLQNTNPDLVLMHLGTNDVWNNISTQNILAAYTKLITQMRTRNPRITVLVAKILPMNPGNCGACAQRAIELNNAIPNWASGLSSTQSPIKVVDQWSGFNTAIDTSDGVHPNDSGNYKIARNWFNALTSVLVY